MIYSIFPPKAEEGWIKPKTRLLLQKKCSMIYLILPPKAEEGWIKPDQCQVNSTWLELTYYKETLIITKASKKDLC